MLKLFVLALSIAYAAATYGGVPVVQNSGFAYGPVVPQVAPHYVPQFASAQYVPQFAQTYAVPQYGVGVQQFASAVPQFAYNGWNGGYNGMYNGMNGGFFGGVTAPAFAVRPTVGFAGGVGGVVGGGLVGGVGGGLVGGVVGTPLVGGVGVPVGGPVGFAGAPVGGVVGGFPVGGVGHGLALGGPSFATGYYATNKKMG